MSNWIRTKAQQFKATQWKGTNLREFISFVRPDRGAGLPAEGSVEWGDMLRQYTRQAIPVRMGHGFVVRVLPGDWVLRDSMHQLSHINNEEYERWCEPLPPGERRETLLEAIEREIQGINDATAPTEFVVYSRDPEFVARLREFMNQENPAQPG